jgi:hypothetical protein
LARVEADPAPLIPVAPPDDRTQEPADTIQARSRDLAWTSAALVETLVLVGGLYWIMSGDGSGALWQRVLAVSVVAALSAVAATLWISSRSKPRD